VRATLTPLHGDELTHPDFVALVGPLFVCDKKRAKKEFPSFRLAEERDVERSDDRVSALLLNYKLTL
jgi:hypothetical protein